MNFPRWMNWLFFAFFAYILYLGNFSARDEASAPVAEVEQSAELSQSSPNQSDIPDHPTQGYPKLDDATNLNYWKSAINPNALNVLRSEDIEIGTGVIAGCGSKVRLLLRGTKPDGSNFDTNHDETKPLAFVVGNAPYAALDQLISGMRPGGVRTAKVPLSAIHNKQDAPAAIGTALLRITLQQVMHPNPDANEIAYQALALVPGNPDFKPLQCGEAVTLAVASVNEVGGYGKPSQIHATLGHNDLSLSVNRAAEGMRVGESRLVVAPKNWRKHGQGLVTRITRLPFAPKTGQSPKN